MQTIKELYVLPIGMINISTGKTMYDWSIYDHPTEEMRENAFVFLTNGGYLLYGCKGTFETGDRVSTLRHNDTRRKLDDEITILDSSICKPTELIEMLFRNGYDYRPKRPFQKAKFSRKLMTSYSVK